ncbi:hypothetical protein DFH06DRAFT_1137429 [Mycena polygramma]|nr:hypothetical protein DFH06DRAFT_1137429 [Mycena polygramma]
MPPPAVIDFDAVLGILRLSHKYDVGYLRKRALCHLETIYPVQLTAVGLVDDNKVRYDSAIVDLDLVAIPILHEVAATWLLPSAYYNVATFPAGTLYDCSEEWAQFPSELKQTCLVLRDYNLEATDRIYKAIAPLSDCASRDACDALKFRFLRQRSSCYNLAPLSRPNLHNFLESNKHGFCRDCSTQGQERYCEVRAAIWN